MQPWRYKVCGQVTFWYERTIVADDAEHAAELAAEHIGDTIEEIDGCSNLDAKITATFKRGRSEDGE